MDLKKLLQFQFEQQPEQFNMTAPENLMMPEVPPPAPKKQKTEAPRMPSAEVSVPAPDASAKVKEYIKSKYGLLDPEAYDAEMLKAESDAKSRKSGLGVAQFLAGVGDAFAGRGSSETAKTFDGHRKNIEADTTGKLESRRKSQMENLSSNSMMDKMQREKDVSDPNSSQSMAFRKIIESKFPEVARAYGPEWANVSAADKDLIFQPLQLKEQVDARKETARILASERSALKEDKLDKDRRERTTPFGLANTADDAKKLKEASELKSKLDSQVSELIALRKAKGAEVMNRDVVARAKQLSNDLLLTKKNLESLGVLSQSDKDIVNEIIPSDPTEFKFAQLAGQDPILTKLENFKKDTDNDFSGRLKTRLSDPSSVGSGQFPRQVRKGNQTATVSNEAELKEAQAEGFQ